MTTATEFWAGQPGDEYQERNATASVGSVGANVALFSRILARTDSIKSILEIGAGVGNNLKAIHRVMPFIALSAVELNRAACGILMGLGITKNIVWGSIHEYEHSDRHDMVFTKGVLIHIPPSDLPRAYDAIYNASRRYVLLCEYFNPTPVMVPYRGEPDRLWKRDFAGEMLDRYHDLRLVDYGFMYRRDEYPQDNLNWWLMEKQ